MERVSVLRERARKLRVVAETIPNQLTRESLLAEAETYERMAAEEERKKAERRSPGP